MRPQRFMDFAVRTYSAAGLEAEPWQDGTKRPFGVRVRLPGGGQIWHAVTAAAPPGEDYAAPEQPVEKEAPAPVPLPALGNGPVPVPAAEQYLAALLTNAGSLEIIRAYGYSGREASSQNPGLGVEFHSGGKIHCVFVHAARAGQQRGQEYALPGEI
ncbi:hypothetical protein [Streptomyces aidingensis]|uniref:Uncharacterized protein n=1 Tax=Streptomyces aidingensis TaxID=910347 RepID=A0A1I1R3G5_9ACTN|nr:hypothetical protein [Streptomyces aidingensis]SFD28839.1 hypothetical protein SAMN05421773_112160 [Streptomyces aidingensis]